MKKFNGQNVLDHKSRSYKEAIIGLSVAALIGLITIIGVHELTKTGATATLDNYKVKLVYDVTWDAYCLNPRLEVTNLKNHSRKDVHVNGYQGPCGQRYPATFWMKTGDFNHDGHKDFSILSAYDVSRGRDSAAYTEFIYTPSAPASMPFVQE